MSASAGRLDLAVIGNCQVNALIDPHGQLVWGAFPRPDSDPAFCALLHTDFADAARGVFAIDCSERVQAEQHYRRNSAVLETVLTDAAGDSLRITDFCPRFRQNGRIFRPPSVVRIIEPLLGTPQVRLRFRPAARYGAEDVTLHAGSHHVSFQLPDMAGRVTTNASLTALLESRPFRLDAPLAFVFGVDEGLDQPPQVHAGLWLAQTDEYWQEWVRSLAVPADWQEAVIRAAITLKLCTFEDTGAVLAALTTSIPESADSGRNWDYRACWLRDSFFVVQALNRLGATRTMEGYLRYIINIATQASGGVLQPLYGINGEAELPERIVESLPGYRGMGPVRVGNAAVVQRQHDVYGAVVMAASQCFFDARLMSPGDLRLFQQLEAMGTQAAALLDSPDAGPWEFRGREQCHTFSAAMCWAACDRLARIAAQLGLQDRGAHWNALAEDMRARILRRAWHPQRRLLASSLDGDGLDATVLLLPELGLIDARDERFLATLDAVERELREGDLIFRYRHSDDFGLPHNAFTVCSFWYVNALAAAGRRAEAREIFERLLLRRNRLGLLSEDIDPVSGEQWGNYPQTYSMVGVIGCARRLSRSWEEVV